MNAKLNALDGEWKKKDLRFNAQAAAGSRQQHVKS